MAFQSYKSCLCYCQNEGTIEACNLSHYLSLPFLGFHKVVRKVPAEPDLSWFIPRGGHSTCQVKSGSFCQLECPWQVIR